MMVIKGIRTIKKPLPASVVTVGVFDGIHIGHALVIKKAVARAKDLGVKSVVVTFDPHPAKVMHPRTSVPSLISLAHRTRLIGSLGADILVVTKFTKAIAGLSAEKFVKRFLIDKLGMREMYVGENFYFGKGAAADKSALKKLSGKMGFKINVIKPVSLNGKIVSSSIIREQVVHGRLHEAARFLGRPVSVLGTVVKGLRIGRILGFPTANIDPHHEAIPPGGVYAVKVRYKKRLLGGVLNIGSRPTFFRSGGDGEPTVEVHIFNFNKDIYGEDLEINFIKKLRDERRFRNKDELAAQIRKDAAIAYCIVR